MSVEPTSPEIPVEHGLPAVAGPAPTLAEEWRRLGRFVRRPALPETSVREGALTVLARVFALDVLAMLALILAAMVAVAAGVYIPETALAGIEFTPVIVLLVVVVAPVLEELVFRGWLSGRPGVLLALLALGLGAAGFGAVHATQPLAGFAVLVGGAVAAIAALVLLRRRAAMGWFAAFFPLFYWISVIAFALVHLWNFDEGSLLILLPLVLPQFILGMLLGYVRVQVGLWAAILLHAAHNSAALSIAALAMGMDA